MIEFEESDDDAPKGLPAWLATFADLMSLLMCFFVLLLAFSEMDVLKYKQVAGSMRDAFGVQNEINVKDIPKGTSLIAQEFSPGRPDPSPTNEVRQKTVDSNRNTLDTRAQTPGEQEKGKGQAEAKGPLEDSEAKKLLVEKLKELIEETEEDAKKIADALHSEIKAGKVEVSSVGRTIKIRILEKGSFPSGSATLDSAFKPVMAKMRYMLKDIKGKIAVEGHTDNVPISTSRFRSNWDLSSSRALSVAHELMKDSIVSSNRFLVSGYADTLPVAENTNRENRAKNRRVEIVIRQGLDSKVSKELKSLQSSQPNLMETLQVEDTLDSEDISAIEDLL